MIGYTVGHGVSAGWEAGGGWPAGLVRLNVGGDYRSAADHTAPAGTDQPQGLEAIHYLALEPLTGTVGLALSDVRGWGLMGGAWLGWFVPFPDGGADPFEYGIDCPAKIETMPVVSAAVGARFLAGAWELYFTPKIGLLTCLEYAS